MIVDFLLQIAATASCGGSGTAGLERFRGSFARAAFIATFSGTPPEDGYGQEEIARTLGVEYGADHQAAGMTTIAIANCCLRQREQVTSGPAELDVVMLFIPYHEG